MTFNIKSIFDFFLFSQHLQCKQQVCLLTSEQYICKAPLFPNDYSLSYIFYIVQIPTSQLSSPTNLTLNYTEKGSINCGKFHVAFNTYTNKGFYVVF